MTRPAVAALAVAALIAALSCARSVRTHPGSAPPAFASPFTAIVSSGIGHMRFSGVLAVAEGGLLRVEVARGGESFLFVAGEDGTSAVLSSAALFLREGAGSRLLSELTGVGLEAEEISSALRGAPFGLPPGCVSDAGRWREAGEAGRLPTRVRIRCGREELRIRLGRPEALANGRADAAFMSLGVPPGYRQASALELAEALREELGRR